MAGGKRQKIIERKVKEEHTSNVGELKTDKIKPQKLV